MSSPRTRLAAGPAQSTPTRPAWATEELAALLCPFAEGERIRIPRPAHAGNHDEGEIRGVWFDRDYGYHLYLGYDDGRQGTVSAYMNAELELCNGKEPALPATLRDKCLYLLRDSLSYV